MKLFNNPPNLPNILCFPPIPQYLSLLLPPWYYIMLLYYIIHHIYYTLHSLKEGKSETNNCGFEAGELGDRQDGTFTLLQTRKVELQDPMTSAWKEYEVDRRINATMH